MKQKMPDLTAEELEKLEKSEVSIMSERRYYCPLKFISPKEIVKLDAEGKIISREKNIFCELGNCAWWVQEERSCYIKHLVTLLKELYSPKIFW